MTSSWKNELYRQIPKVDEFIARPAVVEALRSSPRWLVLDIVRELLDDRRSTIALFDSVEESTDYSTESLDSDFMALLEERSVSSLRPLINATGIIVHTNLGRSCLPSRAVKQAELAALNYSNLEYNIDAGKRGSRQDHVEAILCRLTGAEAALTVNNNAAAVLLCLNTVAEGREVVVSRGQLVEIGGSFRIPDVMKRSGAILREVGATNKTRVSDYRDAIHSETALLLKVHTSNFQVVGFTSSVELSELVTLGSEHSLPVMEDLGSGSLVDLSRFGLRGEPTVQETVAAGADLVTFSGDKLLGGPQAGLIAGKAELIDRIRKNPLHRALRQDKVTLATLEATLKIYLEGEKSWHLIPTLKMISEPVEKVRLRAQRLLRRISKRSRLLLGARTLSVSSQVGGGSLPLHEIPSAAVAVGSPDRPAHSIEKSLRSLSLPVIGRIHEGVLILDLRTVRDSEVKSIAEALEKAALA